MRQDERHDSLCLGYSPEDVPIIARAAEILFASYSSIPATNYVTLPNLFIISVGLTVFFAFNKIREMPYDRTERIDLPSYIWATVFFGFLLGLQNALNQGTESFLVYTFGIWILLAICYPPCCCESSSCVETKQQ